MRLVSASRRPGRLHTLLTLLTVCFFLLLILAPTHASAFNDDGDDDDVADDEFDRDTAENDREPEPAFIKSPEALEVQKLSDASLLWGSYRPQVYFGFRPRLPDSLLTGLSFFGLQDYQSFQKLRNKCSDQQGMKGYPWKYHDGREFGIQEINDVENNYRLETSFFKVDTENSNGGSWAVRISGTVMDPAKPAALSTIWYTAIESLENSLSLEPRTTPGQAVERGEPVRLAGSAKGLGDFTIRIEEPDAAHGNANVAGNSFADPSGSDLYAETADKTHVYGMQVPVENVWKVDEIMPRELMALVQESVESTGSENMRPPPEVLQLKDQVAPGSTFYAVQKSFTGNFTFDVFYDSATTPKGALLSSAGLSHALRAATEAYDRRFSEKLRLSSRNYTREQIAFARDLTASVVGGIGYFYGNAIVDRTYQLPHDAGAGSGNYNPDLHGKADPQFTEPQQLFSATPSRSVFPRGFYWDEGFHLAHIAAWDNDLSLDILRSWIQLTDEDGWIAREQILGAEARSRVPDGFQTQYPQYGNPPTLILAVGAYVDRLVRRGEKLGLDASAIWQQDAFNDLAAVNDAPISEKMLSSPALGQEFLREIYPKFRRHYRWFRRTQRGEIREWDRNAISKSEGYRWRGRSKEHVLTSGLDDYPRAPVPHTGELHVDLHSWMGIFAETMNKVARVLGHEEHAAEYERHYVDIVANLDDLHWSDEAKMYCDASVDDDGQSFHVCHAGYISLFPFMLELLPPDSPHLGHVLDLLSDPEQLWSSYGIRSLSPKDDYYGKGDNYWCGPIWVHMSYLTLRALRNKYATTSGPFQQKAQQIYEALRSNVVDNTFKEYQRTNYVYEQYNPMDGHGQRNHPFTGWTSTVALMMAEIFP